MEPCPAVGYVAHCVNTYAPDITARDEWWVWSAVAVIVAVCLFGGMLARRPLRVKGGE